MKKLEKKRKRSYFYLNPNGTYILNFFGFGIKNNVEYMHFFLLLVLF